MDVMWYFQCFLRRDSGFSESEPPVVSYLLPRCCLHPAGRSPLRRPLYSGEQSRPKSNSATPRVSCPCVWIWWYDPVPARPSRVYSTHACHSPCCEVYRCRPQAGKVQLCRGVFWRSTASAAFRAWTRVLLYELYQYHLQKDFLLFLCQLVIRPVTFPSVVFGHCNGLETQILKGYYVLYRTLREII